MSNKTSQTDFSSKLIDALIKLLITGSGGSAIYFLYTNELPKAALATLVSGGFALLTSFGEGLMSKLKGGMRNQGEAVGDATSNAIGNVRDLAWAKLSGLSQQYREALKAHCYAVEVEGFQDLPGLALEDVFVPLRVESTEQTFNLDEGLKEIWDFLPKASNGQSNIYRRLVILAAPGYGKTTLMRHLTLTFVTNPPQELAELMPILLRFREVYSLMKVPSLKPNQLSIDLEDPNDFEISLPELIIRHLETQPEFRKATLTKNWLSDQLNRGNCLVLLDGLDEVPKTNRQDVRRWVEYQMKFYGNTQFLITSRPHGFEQSLDEPSCPITVDLKLKVLDFTPDQKQDFVEKWYRTLLWRLNWEPLFSSSQRRETSSRLTEEQARLKSDQEAQKYASDLVRQIFNNPPINDLARNPLLITMIASTHRAQTILPKRRVELYDKIFDLLLGTRPYAKKMHLSLTSTKIKVVLQELAWNLVNLEETQFTRNQVRQWIFEILNRCTEDRAFSPDNFLAEMTDIAGIIVEKEHGYYEFSHQTLQEYLAAKYLRERENGEATLKTKLANDRWKEVIQFYTALGDATSIVNALMREEAPNEYALLLAQHCMEEAREIDKFIHASLRKRIDEFVKQNPLSPLNKSNGILRLERRFKQSLRENVKYDYDTSPVTWGEYRLFLEAQREGQFHSNARILSISPDKDDQPVTNISWQDARWFCAWLSTQTNLRDGEQIYDYRLPFIGEVDTNQLIDLARKSLIPFTLNPDEPGNTIVVIREDLPKKYARLLNYLANSRWEEADDETNQLMPAGNFDSLSTAQIQDVKIINQLWIKYSDGQWGFSVQKDFYMEIRSQHYKTYVEQGKPLDNVYRDHIYNDFCDLTGWTSKRRQILTNYRGDKQKGQLPYKYWKIGVAGGVSSIDSLFSKVEF